MPSIICSRARVHFSEAADSYSRNLVEHANLYFGIAKALQLSSNKLAHAADVMTKSLASGARMPTYLIEQTIEALGLAEEKRDLRRVTEAIIETGGDQALDELATSDAALEHCPSLADKLGMRAEADGRAAVDRAADSSFGATRLTAPERLERQRARPWTGLERLAQVMTWR